MILNLSELSDEPLHAQISRQIRAKILSEFSTDHEVFELKGGLVDGASVDPGQIEQLAKLPSLDSLRSMLVGLIQAPATKIARLLAEPGAQVARLVEARRAKLEAEGGN